MTPDWVWRQARKGTIPNVKLGRYRRFREEAIEQVAARARGPDRRAVSGGRSSFEPA